MSDPIPAALLLDPGKEWTQSIHAFGEHWKARLESTHPGAAFNFSAIMHEDRHFDDVVLSPWGSYLFSAYFLTVVRHLDLWRRVQRLGIKKIKVPVSTCDLPGLEDSIRLAVQAVAERESWARGGSYCFEMLAYWFQAVYAWDVQDDEVAAKSAVDYFSSTFAEMKLLDGLSTLAEEWGAPPEEFCEVLYRLIIGCLGQASPDYRFVRTIQSLWEAKIKWDAVKAILFEAIFPPLEDHAALANE